MRFYALGDREAPTELLLDYDDGKARGFARSCSRQAEPTETVPVMQWHRLVARDDALRAATELLGGNAADTLLSLELRVQAQVAAHSR